MGKMKSFFKESVAELKKVNWPTRDQVVSYTKVVLVSTIIFAVFFGLVDYVFFQAVNLIF